MVIMLFDASSFNYNAYPRDACNLDNFSGYLLIAPISIVLWLKERPPAPITFRLLGGYVHAIPPR
jgi:hypothetical protein